MNFHGLIRATEALDLFVRPDPENIERLRRALRAVWADPDIEQITAQDLCGDYPVVRYGPPRARVATPRTLYRMKKDTVRAIDHADANALQIAFALSDED